MVLYDAVCSSTAVQLWCLLVRSNKNSINHEKLIQYVISYGEFEFMVKNILSHHLGGQLRLRVFA